MDQLFLRLIILMIVLISPGMTLSAENRILKPETVIWDYKLDIREVFKYWPNCAELVRDGDLTVLKITSHQIEGKIFSDKNRTSVSRSFSKDEMTKIRGKTITCSVMCKGENLRYDSACFKLWTGRFGHKVIADKVHAAIGNGSFDWKLLKFTITIASDTSSVEIILGLQRCEPGTVFFKNLKVIVSE